MGRERIVEEGLTFDDLLLLPALSSVLPSEVKIKTRVTKNLELHIPLVSAAMDTVTESELAISMAQEGGIGMIHKNMTVQEQAQQIDKVKRSESGLITDPITVCTMDTVRHALDLMEKYHISGLRYGF